MGISNERASTTPLVLGAVFLAVVLLCATLATAEMAAERARQQNGADLGALAGANALSKATQTTRIIDASIYSRNVSLDAMYLAATIVSIASAGTGAEAFAVPLKFQKATEEPVAALEKTKAIIGETAVVYSIANGAAIIKANGGDSGLAIPMPLIGGFRAASQKEKDLKKMIKVYEGRVKIAALQMAEAAQAYREKRDALKREGYGDDEIESDADVTALKTKMYETRGRVGGLTTQRNRRQKELAALTKTRGVFAGGQTGVVAVVRHRSSPIAFTQPLGGLETGDNLAVAAARIENGPVDATIGEDALRNLMAKLHLPGRAADTVAVMIEYLNLAGGKMRNLEQDYGPIGGYLGKTLETLGLEPPLLTETRPALAGVDTVLTDGSDLYATAKEAFFMAKTLEAKLGVDILPSDIRF